jgi:hypothetical protein
VNHSLKKYWPSGKFLKWREIVNSVDQSHPRYAGVILFFADILNFTNKTTIAAGAMLIAIRMEQVIF